MGEIISFAAYRKKKGIAAPRSPYSTLKATDDQIQDALQRAAEFMSDTYNRSGKPLYAVLIGFEDKHGDVRLLKSISGYSSKESFEAFAGRKGFLTLALTTKAQ